ncbi:NCS2 family permease [Candidatus Pelagibacter sp.]|jgi:AGZA family xanthine/uracil permease-like MFS transporter|nr:NCS2 family permease [Candidatus Pelagibacter sp.]
MLEKYFDYKKHKTDFNTEVRAGVTTFLTMAYILALQPMIMKAGGFDGGSIFTATVFATAIACFIMGFYGKTWPIGLSCGMGLNAYVAYYVCGALGYTPQEALGAVLAAGILFLAISLTPIRAWIINAIPRSLKLGIGAGIGLFLALIGFTLMGLTVPSENDTVIKLTQGFHKDPLIMVALAALITMFVLDKLKVRGAIIIALTAWTVIAWIFIPNEILDANYSNFGGFENGIVSMNIPPMTHLLDFNLSAIFSGAMLSVVFTLFFVDFFDTAGTLTSVANVAGKVDSKGHVEDIDKALLADSAGTVAGALLGTTTVTSYVESGSGVKEGGRTGMTSIVIGVLFLSMLFFSPLFLSIPKQIDAAVLIFVSILFLQNLKDIEWDDITESGPAALAAITMAYTYSISHGIAVAFVAYALIKIFTGKIKGVSPAIWIVAILSAISLYLY